MDDKKRKYAKFLINRCLSMKQGEPLVIGYLKDHKPFVDIIKEEANKLGITEIYDIENDSDKTREILMNSTLGKIEKEPYFDRSIIKDVYDKGGSYLSLTSYAESKLKDIPSDKKSLMNKIKVDTQKDAVEARGIYKFPWCIAAVATDEWASKVRLKTEEELWDTIFKITLMDKEDPVEAWNEKIKKNTKRRNLLNELKLSKLRYKNNLGTDLEIGLPKDVIWWGAAKKSFDGTKDLIVNMPTEEVFTTPDKNKTNGIVYSSKPLAVKSTIIEKFSLTFEDGKVAKVWASNDDDKLLELIEEYDGMNFLGECALVDYDSPISLINMIFYSILVDENASCHLALGRGFPKAVPNGDIMTEEELEKCAINRSKNHVDFMVGTNDLSIVGTDIYGNEVPIFVDGNFAEDKIVAFIKNRKVAKKMKNIIITGASDGLGRAIATELKEHNLILVSRNEEKLKELSDELNCKYYVCDLTDYNSIENMMKEIKDVDVLINNAGVWLAGDLEENTFDKISTCIDVNTKAPIYMTKAVLPIMRKKKSGLIVNVCSQSSFDNDDFSSVYNASKWAMRGFNRSIQRVLSKENIKVTGFYPGFMQTDLFKKAGNDYDTSTGLEVEKVAKSVKFITECEDDIIIPEFGIKDVENY